MVVLLALAVLLSTNRRAIRLRTVGAALALQVTFGVLVLFVPAGQAVLEGAARAVQAVIDSSSAGIEFLFGSLVEGDAFIFAFQVLPVIVFFASLSAVLYHWGILQKVVELLGGALSALLGTRKAESVNAAANIFVGQTEAPLVIRPYIPRLTRSGLFAVMVGGLHRRRERAMLLAFISLIALINLILGGVGGLVGLEDLTFEKILGYVFAPLMLVIGVPWGEALDAGSYVGQKVVVNEFVAFTNFAPVIDDYSQKTQAVVTFALTGFANLGSLGILLGGLGGLAPERRSEIAQLGIKAIMAATLANLISAAIAGIIIG